MGVRSNGAPQKEQDLINILIRTDNNLTSTTAKSSQGQVRTAQVLNQSLQQPFVALQVLEQVLENPGETFQFWGILGQVWQKLAKFNR